jgi:menaquinone-dependent protoporphyrinogen oxidase
MSDRVLIAYASRYGATAELAEAIAKPLRAAGLDVDVWPARHVRWLDDYRAVIVGSAVYAGRWRRDALHLLRSHQAELSQRPVWLFSSGPVGADKGEPAKLERWTKPRRADRLGQAIGAREHVVFGGRVSETGSYIRRAMAKGSPPELRDRRDWAAVEAWGAKIATALTAADVAAAA